MPDTDPAKSYIQTSFRISHETQSAIRSLALAKNVSQSDLLRAAIGLYSHTEGLASNLKLAVVDVDNAKNATHYFVKSWIIE